METAHGSSQYFKTDQLFLSLSPLQLNLDMVTQIEKTLGLTLISEQQPHRVCFANQNAELQDAYKQVFSATDLLDYVYAVLISEKGNTNRIQLLSPSLPAIPYPTDNLNFWKLVKLGQQYRLSLS
ncbi:hypothetical protein QSV37_15450 [Acinetobacter sp. VNK23]|uniref:type ISP restriction/modification enzyme n=1 Tax=Acinetobacter thutiue TaxID=2998078 RepID=UPI0025791DE9|nr:type ISP restriction/modification enzyme [Acinetobacter thutiue]MDM1021685.1 hypothetical protein [Acinetobacter thutiue]